MTVFTGAAGRDLAIIVASSIIAALTVNVGPMIALIVERAN
jgi:hypothetical protein